MLSITCDISPENELKLVEEVLRFMDDNPDTWIQGHYFKLKESCTGEIYCENLPKSSEDCPIGGCAVGLMTIAYNNLNPQNTITARSIDLRLSNRWFNRVKSEGLQVQYAIGVVDLNDSLFSDFSDAKLFFQVVRDSILKEIQNAN